MDKTTFYFVRAAAAAILIIIFVSSIIAVLLKHKQARRSSKREYFLERSECPPRINKTTSTSQPKPSFEAPPKLATTATEQLGSRANSGVGCILILLLAFYAFRWWHASQREAEKEATARLESSMTRDQALVYRLIQNSLDEGYIAFSHEARAGQTKVPSQERTDEAWMRFVENNTITFTALAVALGEERCQAVGAMAFTLFQAGVASAFNPELDRKDVWRATRHEVIILIRNMDIR